MADNFTFNDPSGTSTGASDVISSVHYPRVKVGWGVDGTFVDTSATNPLPIAPITSIVRISVDVTRQAADTTQYSINDAISDSTSAPTSGGFTITSAARASGGSGYLVGLNVASSNPAGTPLSGEVHLFNTSVTNINDNAAFAISDSEVKTCEGVIPFTLVTGSNNGFYRCEFTPIPYVCSGSANLRFLLKAKNAYTPVGSEVLTFIFYVQYQE